MKKYKFVKQSDFKDCGICCLQMIIKHYNGNVGKEKLREITKTNKFGTTAYHLTECLKYFGFSSTGMNVSINDLNKVTLPCIAHVTINKSFNHYVVIYNLNEKKKQVIIADPAKGVLKMSYSSFNEIFNNIIITAKPIKPIPILYKEVSYYRFIKEVISEYKIYFIKLLLISLFITLLAIVGTFYFQVLIDGTKKELPLLYSIFIMFSIIKLLELLINYIRNKILININQKISNYLTPTIFFKIISLPYNYYRNRTTGEIISRINDLNIVRDITSKFILTIMIDLILTIISSIFLLKINQYLFIISFIISIFYIMIYILFKNKTKNYVNEVQDSNSSVNSYMIETISGFETIKGLGVEGNFKNKFNNIYSIYLNKLLRFDKFNNLKNSILNTISEFNNYLIIFIGIILVKKNYLSVGQVIMFQMLSIYFISPIKTILDMDISLNEAGNAFKRISEILPTFKLKKGLNNSISDICLDNVYYSLDDQSYVLKNISLKIPKSEKVMIVGKSGVGKSTILKLIKGYYETTKGNILLNDHNIAEYSKESINDNILYLSQNEYLFTDTVYNNITLKEKVSNKLFKQICSDCLINDVISKDSLGYYMVLEENGFNISGGEKQRIVLARALIRNFNIILIDEGFSELDTTLERKILKNIFKTFSDKTFIIVSHRLDNVDLFDKLIEVKDGKIVKNIKRKD